MTKNEIKTEIKKQILKWACPYVAIYRRGKQCEPDKYESYFVYTWGEMLDELNEMVDSEFAGEDDFEIYDDSICLWDVEGYFACIPEKSLIPMGLKEIEDAINTMFYDDPYIKYFTLTCKTSRGVYKKEKICNIDIFLGEVWDRAIQNYPHEEIYPVAVNFKEGYIRIVEPGGFDEYILKINNDEDDDSGLPVSKISKTLTKELSLSTI